jgi:hypothetical protein
MGSRKVKIRRSAAESISGVAWYIESKGLLTTAEKFLDDVYDALAKLGDRRVSYSLCREKKRNLLGLKCKTFRKKYTIVFFESEHEIIVHEFLPSKLIRW